EHRIGVDVGKGITQAAEVVGNGLDRFVGFGRREGFARLDLNQWLYLIVEPDQVARQLYAAYDVRLPFVHGEVDVNAFTIGRNADLRRLGRVFEIAAIEVIGTYALYIALELFA